MAARYYGLSRGEGEVGGSYVAEGSSTTSKELEVVIATTGTVTKEDFVRMLGIIERHVLESTDNLVA